jgi:WD40 repeat protein
VGLIGVGCEDGSAKLFSYADSGLEYVRSMQPTGSRVLCLCFDPSQPRLFAGCADGTIRCFNEVTGVSMFRLTGDATKGLPTAIWSLHVTKDSTVVSGDNRGQLQFWNGASGDELLCTLQQHTAPVLAICSSAEGDRVFASGVDSRVICVNRLHRQAHHEDRHGHGAASGASAGEGSSSSAADPSQWKWVYASAHRPHSHDVQALAVVPVGREGEQGRPLAGPMLISGSEDCKLCVYSVNDFVGARPTWVLPVPARCHFTSLPQHLAC